MVSLNKQIDAHEKELSQMIEALTASQKLPNLKVWIPRFPNLKVWIPRFPNLKVFFWFPRAGVGTDWEFYLCFLTQLRNF